MTLCPLLHKSIVSSNGNKSSDIEDCYELCEIIKQKELSCGIIVRYILESKYRDSVKADGTIRSCLFSVNKKCTKKLSVIKKTDSLRQDLKNGEPKGEKIIGYTELDIDTINKLEEKLIVIQDNYKYEASNELDFENHCSLCSFSGKNLKELQKELKIQADLAKIASKFISLEKD